MAPYFNRTIGPIQQPYIDSPDSNRICSVLEAMYCQYEGLARRYKMERENPAKIAALRNSRNRNL